MMATPATLTTFTSKEINGKVMELGECISKPKQNSEEVEIGLEKAKYEADMGDSDDVQRVTVKRTKYDGEPEGESTIQTHGRKQFDLEVSGGKSEMEKKGTRNNGKGKGKMVSTMRREFSKEEENTLEGKKKGHVKEGKNKRKLDSGNVIIRPKKKTKYEAWLENAEERLKRLEASFQAIADKAIGDLVQKLNKEYQVIELKMLCLRNKMQKQFGLSLGAGRNQPNEKIREYSLGITGD